MVVLFDLNREGWVGQSLTGFIHKQEERKGGSEASKFYLKEFLFKRTSEIMPPWGLC